MACVMYSACSAVKLYCVYEVMLMTSEYKFIQIGERDNWLRTNFLNTGNQKLGIEIMTVMIGINAIGNRFNEQGLHFKIIKKNWC